MLYHHGCDMIDGNRKSSPSIHFCSVYNSGRNAYENCFLPIINTVQKCIVSESVRERMCALKIISVKH